MARSFGMPVSKISTARCQFEAAEAVEVLNGQYMKSRYIEVFHHSEVGPRDQLKTDQKLGGLERIRCPIAVHMKRCLSEMNRYSLEYLIPQFTSKDVWVFKQDLFLFGLLQGEAGTDKAFVQGRIVGNPGILGIPALA